MTEPAAAARAILGTVPDPRASLTAAIVARLIARREPVAVSEFSTGGLISASRLSIPGASAYFVGGGLIDTHAARRLARSAVVPLVR